MSAASVSRTGLPFSPGLGDRDLLEVRLHPVGDPVEDVRAFGDRGTAPRVGGAVRGVQRPLHVVRGAAGDLGEVLAGHRGRVLEVLTLGRRNVFATDVVVVAALVVDDRAVGSGRGVNSHDHPPYLGGYGRR